MSTNNLFNVSLSLYKIIGEHMGYTSKFLIVFRTINIIICSILLVFVTRPLFEEGHKNFSRIVEAVVVVAHPLLKYILLIYNKSYVQGVLTDRSDDFWNSNQFHSDFIASEEEFCRIIRIIQLVLPVSSIAGIVFCMLRPVLYTNRLYPVESWIVDSLVINAVVMASQYYLLAVLVPMVVSYDSLYLALCVRVVIQTRRLKYILGNLTANTLYNSQKKLIYCIKHHQFLIVSFLNMRSVFSLTLLFHYFVTLISSCIELYTLMGNEALDLAQILYVFILFCQFGYYTFPAEQVATELGDLSNSLYMSQWYRTTPDFKKLALFIMAKSQVTEQFSGSGIIPINIDTFGSVLRKSFSFYAVLRNILNK